MATDSDVVKYHTGRPVYEEDIDERIPCHFQDNVHDIAEIVTTGELPKCKIMVQTRLRPILHAAGLMGVSHLLRVMWVPVVAEQERPPPLPFWAITVVKSDDQPFPREIIMVEEEVRSMVRDVYKDKSISHEPIIRWFLEP